MSWLVLVLISTVLYCINIFVDNYVSDYYFKGKNANAQKNFYWIPFIIIGIIIAIWIGYTAIKLFIESYDVLMDKSIDNSTKDEVLEIIKRHKEVIRVNHFNSTPVGYRYQISFTIYVDGNLSTFESHDIANKLEREIEKEIEEVYLTVIHVNPIKIEKKK